jgi:AcrR family transcriptional regulator
MVQKEQTRRGRPRNYDPESAIARATEAFWQAGYSGTSLDDLSAAAGMNRPSLYAAFGDKRDLYLKALAQYWATSLVNVQKALPADQPVREALALLYERAMASYVDGGRGCFAISTATTESADTEIRTLLMRGLRDLDAAIEERLRLARSEGELHADRDPKALAALASGVLHTLAIRARAGASQKELRSIAANAVELICR